MQLVVGKTYRAKKPLRRYSLLLGHHYNDRTIIWMGGGRVQYDGPAVAVGRHYPSVTEAEFLAWAGEVMEDEDEIHADV